MDKEKFVQRIENMLYVVCGCNKKEAKEVLNECLRLKYEKDSLICKLPSYDHTKLINVEE